MLRQLKKGKYINSDQERKGQYDREFKSLGIINYKRFDNSR